ncbi:peptidyl-prolyl cis-trans isomerase D [Rhizoclosmatium globosum]|uniref:peptidylprolyl isomerase n=1 Tax=Rhizoclosmatium globosum TaxID=329046 RepID=A0A1Y2C013_9FUNG|nr:peptidyl-prolyl cis-trans isomerase D [Rhizoclosmatium globosum]|eukprot:ORY40254.1 peptidyl-prolyl cis-trans isomerase D [Rhizoclosmatium globosum]
MATEATRPQVFFSITIGDVPAGKIVMELYDDIAPRTTKNFQVLCQGNTVSEDGIKLTYKGCSFHRVIKNFMLQGGDFTNHNGTGGVSIYGEKFEDETFEVKHEKAGLLSMANAGPNTNGSQFFITTVATPHLDGKHVVFGRVIKGMGVVRRIENTETNDNDKPYQPVIIADCGDYDAKQEAAAIAAASADGDVYEEYPEDQLPADGSADGLKPDELLAIAGAVKQIGTDYFKKQDYATAAAKYEKAVRYLMELHPDPEDIAELSIEQKKLYYSLKVSCLLNISMCGLKLNAWAQTVKETSKVLAIEQKLKGRTDGLEAAVSASDKTKALFRRGQAKNALKEYENAVKDLTEAVALAPEDKLIARELAVGQKAIKDRAEKEKKMYAKMFS